jgi:hypothetical protein
MSIFFIFYLSALVFLQKQNKYLIARKYVDENNEAERFQKVVIDRLIQLDKDEEKNRPFSLRLFFEFYLSGLSYMARIITISNALKIY